MSTEPNPREPASALAAEWQARERYWSRKLGRIRLGAEPVDEQLAKYRRVTWMLTAVPLGLALMFVSLFAAFHRADIGAVLSGILLLPVAAIAWLDFAILRSRVLRYTKELREHEKRRAASGRT